MSRKTKFDPKIEAQIATLLDKQADSLGTGEVRHAAMKWCNRQKKVQKLMDRKKEIELELDQIDKEVKGAST